MSSAVTTVLNVSNIRVDGGTQIRSELNQHRVEELADLLKEGIVFKDPVTVFYDGTEYWLGDGFHRVDAAKLAGIGSVDADVRSGTREDAIEYACGANATHGLPRNNKDKRNAVLRLLDLFKWQEKSNRDVAKQCGVTEFLVRTVRSELPEDHPAAIKSQKPINQPVERDEADDGVGNFPTSEEKRKFAEDFLRDNAESQNLSNREVARKFGIDHKTVATIKKELEEYKQKLELEESERQRKAIIAHFDDYPGSEELSDNEIAKRCEVDAKLVKSIKKERSEEKQRLAIEDAARNVAAPIPEPQPMPLPSPQPMPIQEPVLEIEPVSEPLQICEPMPEPIMEVASGPEIMPEPEPEPELIQIEEPAPEPEPDPVQDQESVTEDAKDSDIAHITVDGIITPSEETLRERGTKRQQTQERNEQLRERGAELPQGRYACLVVDPPWPMKKIERDVRPNQVDFDYPTMTEDELKDFPLPDMAGNDCHLYLWTTQKYLPMALRLSEHWGFKYQCLMTWVKNVGPTPFSWMYTTEHVLFCSKGNLPLLSIGKRLDFVAKGREHSRKPDVFYDLVRVVSPGPRLDVFSREKREGFDQYGNEISKYEVSAR